MVRESRPTHRDDKKPRLNLERESTVNPVIKSISEYDHNDPLTTRKGVHHRGKSLLTPKNQNPHILYKLGNLDDALKKAQSILDNKPKDENYLYLKGRVLEKLDKNNEAEKCFKEALEINPKFSQAAFYLAAIENKRGNFEKSIELYNYALSKDTIPVSGQKTSTPFISVDIGVASDNVIKANFAGKKSNLKTNLRSVNTFDNSVEKNRIPMDKVMSNDFETPNRVFHHQSDSLSTNQPSTIKSVAVNKVSKSQKFTPKGGQSGASSDFPSPQIDKKKLRQAWRIGKSGKLSSKQRNEIEKVVPTELPQEFYSVGNSINKTESFSVQSNGKSSTQVHTEVSSTVKKNKKKKINFSDRMLSSKLYSIKRQEIFLYDNRNHSSKNLKSANKSRMNALAPGQVPRTFVQSAQKKSGYKKVKK